MRSVRLFALLVLCWAALVPVPMAVAMDFACNPDNYPAFTIAGEIQDRTVHPGCDSSKAAGDCNARQACTTNCSACSTPTNNYATFVDFSVLEKIVQPRSCSANVRTIQPDERPPRLI